MSVFNQILYFWSNFLYGWNLEIGDSFSDTALYTDMVNGFANGKDIGILENNPLGVNFQDFIFNFLQLLPFMLAFLTVALAIFLFGFMMYKIIKLFTNAF